MTRTALSLRGGRRGGLRRRAVLLALAKLHLPREDRCGDGDDSHDRECADDREESLDGAEEPAAGVAVAHFSHSSPPASRRRLVAALRWCGLAPRGNAPP